VSTLKQRLAALNVEIPDEPDTDDPEISTYAGHVLEYVDALELALASLAGEVEMLRGSSGMRCPRCGRPTDVLIDSIGSCCYGTGRRP